MKLLASVLLSALACSAADTYPVAGVVINAQTGAALPRAQVYLFRSGAAKPVANMTTANDGRFRLDVPEGMYRMLAGTRVHAQNYGSKYADEGFGSAVIVGPAHDTSSLTFRWFPTAAIFGKITDDTGEPVENALVQLLRSSIAGGRRVTRSAGFTRTNDLGEYRFGSIPGDARYYLSVSGSPWYSAANAFTIAIEPDPNAERPAAFVPVFYPNVTDPSRAIPLTPKPGEEVRADFALARAVGATVTVKHNVPAGKAVTINLIRAGIDGVDSFLDPVRSPAIGNSRADAVFTDVPPGRYTVHVTSGGSGQTIMEGSSVIDVNGSDATAEVNARPAATLTGTLRYANPASAPRAVIVVGLTSDQGVLSIYSAPVRPDGNFYIPAVSAGKYRPVIRNTGSYIVDTQVAGVTNGDGSFKLSPGDSATLNITASADVGEVKGFVMNGDKPVDAVLAVIASATDADGPYRYQGYQTESDGSFDFKYVPPGRYYLFAVEDTALEFANPAALKPYLAGAKAITVEARGSATERIPLAPPAPQ